jgi:hypothetical protein
MSREDSNQSAWDWLRFAQRVGRFIHSQPGKQITRRELLRHFSNRRKSDLSNIGGLLESNFLILAERLGKSIVYKKVE